jgi:hypothetical protein
MLGGWQASFEGGWPHSPAARTARFKFRGSTPQLITAIFSLRMIAADVTTSFPMKKEIQDVASCPGCLFCHLFIFSGILMASTVNGV